MKLFKILVKDLSSVWFVAAEDSGEAAIKFFNGEYITEEHIENVAGPDWASIDDPKMLGIKIIEID